MAVLADQPPRQRFSSTNSVYPPRRDASQGASTQTRRINLVGLNRRPEGRRVGDKGVCKLRARVHAQIMTGDLPGVLICAIDFASIGAANAGTVRPRSNHAHAHCTQARHVPGPCQMALQTAADLLRCARASRRPPALRYGCSPAARRRQPLLTRQHSNTAQPAQFATRAQQHIDLCHPGHEGMGRLKRLRV